MQQILPVAFDGNIIFNFHDGRDESGRQFGHGLNAKPDQARSRAVASFVCFAYVSFVQSVVNTIGHLKMFQQFPYPLVRLQVFGKIVNEAIDDGLGCCATVLIPQKIERRCMDHHLVFRHQMFQVRNNVCA